MVNGAHEDQEIRGYCVLVWNALLPRAPQAVSVAYSTLAEETGVPMPELNGRKKGLHGKSEVLRRVHLFCKEHELAPIDVLVVERKHWAPGFGYRALRREIDGYEGGDDDLVCNDRERVRNTDWTTAPQNPGPENFNA